MRNARHVILGPASREPHEGLTSTLSHCVSSEWGDLPPMSVGLVTNEKSRSLFLQHTAERRRRRFHIHHPAHVGVENLNSTIRFWSHFHCVFFVSTSFVSVGIQLLWLYILFEWRRALSHRTMSTGSIFSYSSDLYVYTILMHNHVNCAWKHEKKDNDSEWEKGAAESEEVKWRHTGNASLRFHNLLCLSYKLTN